MGKHVPRDHQEIRRMADEGRPAREVAETLSLPVHAVEYSLRVTRPLPAPPAAPEPGEPETPPVSAELLAEVRAAINGGPLPAGMSLREYSIVAPRVSAAEKAAAEMARRRGELVPRELALSAVSDIYYRCLDALGDALVGDLVRTGAKKEHVERLLNAASEKVRQVVAGHDELLRNGASDD